MPMPTPPSRRAVMASSSRRPTLTIELQLVGGVPVGSSRPLSTSYGCRARRRTRDGAVTAVLPQDWRLPPLRGRLEVASDSAESATDALATTFGPIRNEVKASEVLSLYRVLLLEYLKDLKVSEAQERDLAQLRAVLGLSQAEADSVYQAAAGPLFRGLIKRLTEAEFGAAQKAELASAVSDLALSEEVTTQLAIDVYSERLSAFATDAKILSEEQAESLRALRSSSTCRWSACMRSTTSCAQRCTRRR